MKAYTDIEQNRKLAEILPIESADMVYEGYKDEFTNEINYIIGLVSNWKSSYPDKNIFEEWNDTFIPCWSLAALLEVIRKTIGYTVYGANNVYISCELGDKPWKMETKVYDNEVDACYEMILKLNELKLL